MRRGRTNTITNAVLLLLVWVVVLLLSATRGRAMTTCWTGGLRRVVATRTSAPRRVHRPFSRTTTTTSARAWSTNAPSRRGRWSHRGAFFDGRSVDAVRTFATVRDDDDADVEEEDTVFALSSGGGGEGGAATAVAVVRITGPKSVEALDRLMNPPSLLDDDDDAARRRQSVPKPRYAGLRDLYEPLDDDAANGDRRRSLPPLLDQALVLYFPGPRSFTGEDVVELHTHGSRAVVADVLRALASLRSSSAAPLLRPADRGEFTRRAYARGRLGLVEVEALADLIVSDTSAQRRQALSQLDGRVTRLYDEWRDALVAALAHAEAVVDFGDDEDLTGDDDDDGDGETRVWGAVRDRVARLREDMVAFAADDRRGEIVRDGVRVAIVGRPNAGKSSLLNALARREAAIVGPAAGTTRDVVEVALDLGGVRCVVSDTAGVRREPDDDDDDDVHGVVVDAVELEGMRRARRVAEEAHLVVWLTDASAKDDDDDDDNNVETLLGLEEGESVSGTVWRVRTKIDLLPPDERRRLSDTTTTTTETDRSRGTTTFAVSCTEGHGMETFLDGLTDAVLSRVGDATSSTSSSSEDGLVITRARHRNHVQEAVRALDRFSDLTDDLMTVDLAAEELRLAVTELGRITGAVDVEDVLDVLFRDFCIGK